MTTIKAIRLASAVTAVNVLAASGFPIAAIIGPLYLVPGAVPTETSFSSAMYAAARNALLGRTVDIDGFSSTTSPSAMSRVN